MVVVYVVVCTNNVCITDEAGAAIEFAVPSHCFQYEQTHNTHLHVHTRTQWFGQGDMHLCCRFCLRPAIKTWHDEMARMKEKTTQIIAQTINASLHGNGMNHCSMHYGRGGGDLGEVRSGLREMMQSIKHEVRVFATACHILIDSVWLLLMCD